MSRPTLEVADIVRASGNRFWEHYGSHLAWQHRKVLDAIVRCRTAALGAHRDQCCRGRGYIFRDAPSSLLPVTALELTAAAMTQNAQTTTKNARGGFMEVPLQASDKSAEGPLEHEKDSFSGKV